MSTNPKNIIRPEYLKNFTKKVKTRFILVEKGSKFPCEINKTIPNVNSKVNVIIQDLNLRITDRQIPYITLMSYYGDVIDNNRIRVFLRNTDINYFYEKRIKGQIESGNNSHILDIIIATAYKQVKISDLSCDAEIVIDERRLEEAIVDILLDIIMFNSYSFLKSMTIDEKRQFSQQKFEFYKADGNNSFYECPNDQLLYYSLAFMARNEDGSFDVERYIKCWNDMVNTYYPGCKHQEKSIAEQIQQHVDRYELPKNFHRKFDTLDDGAYLILRTNRERTEDIHPQLCSLFGITKYRKGKIIIRPISEFDQFIPLLEHLDVSAFKIVKKTDST